MRLETQNTRTLRLAHNTGSAVRFTPARGPQGLPGPGSAAWAADTAVTTGAVRQAPDGSWIKSTGNRTTRPSFDATEATFWEAVLASSGTVEATALTAAIDGNATVADKVAKDDLFFNVKDYGAVGDGVTDDQAAIQAAITAANWPTTRATIYFPPGNYLVGSSISVNGGGATSTPTLSLIGDSAWLTTTTASVNILDITNSVISLTRVRVTGIFFRPNAAGATGVRLNNAELCTFDKCSFGSSFGTGVKIVGTSTYNTFNDCEFVNLARGIEITGDASYLTVKGCHFAEQLSGSPLNWINASTVQSVGVKIAGCTFYGTGATVPVVRIEQGNGWIIANCAFSECPTAAISFSGGDGVSYGHTVTGCSFYRNLNDDIYINGGRKNTLVGNVHAVRHPSATASTYCAVRILNSGGGAAGSDNAIIGCASADTGTGLLNSFSVALACANTTFLGNQYFIAASITATSSAHFGRDGAQVPLGQQYHNGIAGLPCVLARNNTLNGKVTGATTLYTVPTGKTAVITGAIVQSGAVTAITVGPTLGIGIAAGEDDIYPSTALTGLTSNVKTYVFPPQGLQASAPAGSVIKVGIDTASTGTAQSLIVSLLGYLI